jgi:hypothetical protein
MELNKHAVVKGGCGTARPAVLRGVRTPRLDTPPPPAGQVLMVCTSCNTFGAGGPPTGLW